jgi:hypothetical protein
VAGDTQRADGRILDLLVVNAKAIGQTR